MKHCCDIAVTAVGLGQSVDRLTADRKVAVLIPGPGACFSKVPIINGPGKLTPFLLKIEVSIFLHLT